jgi:molybdenum cofactor cytidylyltransferase
MIAAIVLAAGLSRRMGQPKMVLPWGNTTVIGQVTQVLQQAGVEPVIVVTGGAHAEVEDALRGLPVQTVFNSRYAEDHMALSLQIGLAHLPSEASAILVALGDQPQIRVDVVETIVQVYREQRAVLIVPSYQKHRGHPWLVERSLWDGLLALQPPATLRDWFNTHAGLIQYLEAPDDSVLRDLDTPQDYQREHPQSAS